MDILVSFIHWILSNFLTYLLRILNDTIIRPILERLIIKIGFKSSIGEIYSLYGTYHIRYPADYQGSIVFFRVEQSKKFFVKAIGERVFKIPVDINPKALGWIAFSWSDSGKNKRVLEINNAAVLHSCLSIFIAKSNCLGALKEEEKEKEKEKEKDKDCDIKIPIKSSKKYYIRVSSSVVEEVVEENPQKTFEKIKNIISKEGLNIDETIAFLLKDGLKTYFNIIHKYELCNKIYIIKQKFEYPIYENSNLSYETSLHLEKRWIGIHPLLGPLFVLNIYSNYDLEFGCINEFKKLKLKKGILRKNCNEFSFPVSLEDVRVLYIYICPKIHLLSMHE